MTTDIYKQNANRAWKEAWRLWAPPPSLTVSGWAQENRWLSPESNVGRVKWFNESMPHLVEPMDCLSSSYPYRTVCCKFPSQDGKTEIGLNWLAYIIKIDPGPILCIQPNERPMGEAFSKERVEPMLRDTPELQDVVGKVNARTGTTVMHKKFAGGHLSIVGANSPAGLAARPIRYRHLDELDRYPASAGKEGSPIGLSEKRLRRFKMLGIDKSLITSSPTFEDVGVDAEYKKCDVQKQWQISCLSCGKYQYPLREKHIVWRNDDASTTVFKCESCGYEHGPQQELEVKSTGQWITIKDNGLKHSIGFHKSLYTSAHAVWIKQIAEWLSHEGDHEAQQVYVNTEEGETWELKGETIDATGLMARREQYDYEVPEGVYVLTQAVDVQQNRWEIEVRGWGPGFETWGISYETIYGDTSQLDEWPKLWDHLNKSYQSPHGPMRPIWTFIDSGYQSDVVYEFCWAHRADKVFACRGSSELKKPFINAPSNFKLKDKRREIQLYTIGTNAGKLLVFQRLATETPGPGYCHFPIAYTKEYFEQLNSEHCVTRRKQGQLYKVFELRPGYSRRNEPLDILNYNSAAIKFINPVWPALVERRNQKIAEQQERDEIQEKRKQKQGRRPRRQGTWVNNWR